MLNEKETLVRCLDGDRQAQKAIYEHYCSRMLGVCFRYVRTIEDAEDVLQDAFIRAFSNIHQYRYDGSFEAWLRKLMVNTSLNHLHKNRRLKEQLELESVAYYISEDVETDAQLHAKDIFETLKALPDGYRTVINLYSIEGYSHKEIGEMMGINESTSRSQYTRARMLLARLLTAKGRIATSNNNGKIVF
ncbi:MAG: RNA polymerase sigma factor [Bacteroidota bacterium]|nr:RNA polymerase sigma factor [Bacteroidota bacterium]